MSHAIRIIMVLIGLIMPMKSFGESLYLVHSKGTEYPCCKDPWSDRLPMRYIGYVKCPDLESLFEPLSPSCDILYEGSLVNISWFETVALENDSISHDYLGTPPFYYSCGNTDNCRPRFTFFAQYSQSLIDDLFSDSRVYFRFYQDWNEFAYDNTYSQSEFDDLLIERQESIDDCDCDGFAILTEGYCESTSGEEELKYIEYKDCKKGDIIGYGPKDHVTRFEYPTSTCSLTSNDIDSFRTQINNSDPCANQMVLSYNLGTGPNSYGLPTNPIENSSNTCNPINFATGNKYRQERDFFIPDLGIGLKFTRHYNSQNDSISCLGYGWTGSFSESLSVSEDNLILHQSDGADVVFTYNDDQNYFVSETGQSRIIEAIGENWRLTEPNSIILEFDIEGKLIQILDRNGNYLVVQYDGSNLSSVEDNFGRRIDFSYNEDGLLEFSDTPIGRFEYRYDQVANLILVIKPDSTQRSYSYEAPHDSHNLTGITDANGLQALYEYDDQDRAISSERIGGTDRLTVSYEDGLTRTITDSANNTISYELQAEHGIGRIRSSSGSCSSCPSASGTTYEMDDRLNIQSKTDALGNVTLYTYDNKGNVLIKTEASGTSEERTTLYTWHPELNLITSESRESVSNPGQINKIEYEYDENGNLIRQIETGFSETETISSEILYAYNDYGQIIQVDGPRTDITDISSYEYYPNNSSEGLNRGMLKKSIDSIGSEILYGDYNAWGKPGTITDPNGTVTTLGYDVMGRLLSETTSTLGITKSYEYNPVGQLTAIHLPENIDILYTYGNNGLLEKMTDGKGNYIHYFYDSRGNRTREEIRDAQGTLKRFKDFEYDSFSRLKTITHPDGTDEERIYDDNHNLIRSVNADGNSVSYAYDALNRLIQTTQPNNVITLFSHDNHDNLIQVTDAEGRITGFNHDDFGNRISGVSPDTGTTSYSYDNTGNLISKVDAGGNVVSYAYDALNRITAIHFSDQDILYTWDQGPNAQGRVSEISDASGNTIYGYDPLGRVILEEKEIQNLSFAVEYSYDDNGNVTDMVYPSGRIVSYELDSVGQVVKVTTEKDGDVQILAENITYLPFGSTTAVDYGNGSALTYGFDQRYRLTNISDENLQDLSYAYDPVGNITSITDGIDPSKSQAFVYDNLYRLMDADGVYGSLGYTYDKTGNRLTRTENGQTDTYLYESGTSHLIEITGVEPRAFSYDANGNTVGSGSQELVYSQNNRLISVSNNGNLVKEYVYNALGQRVIEHIGETTTIFLYDQSGNLIAESDDGGNSLREYVWLGNRPLAQIAFGDGTSNPDPESLILDNDAPATQYIGTWTNSTVVSGHEGADYRYHAANGASPETIQIDNGDSGFSVTGTWEHSTAVNGHEGTDYQKHMPNGSSPEALLFDNGGVGFNVTGTWTHSIVVDGYEGSDYQYHASNGTSPEATIIDNTDPGFAVIGNWSTSTNTSGYAGSDYLAKAAGNGDETATWTFTIDKAGDYHILARWSAHANRATNAPYTISHDDGSGSAVISTVTVSQQQNGGQNNLLGTYSLEPGTLSVTLSNDADGYVIADAIQIEPVDAAPNTATWTLEILSAGDYDVYAKWPAHPNRAGNAPFTIHHADGESTVYVDQQQNGGEYIQLGTYTFNAGSDHSVTLTDQADGYVIADSILIVPIGALPNTATWALNVPSAGEYEIYAKWTSHSNRATNAPYTIHHADGSTTVSVNQQQNGGQYNLLGTYTLDSDSVVALTDQADGYVIADAIRVIPLDAEPNTVTWNPQLTQEAEYEVYAKWTSHSNRATNAPYTIHYAGGSTTVSVNQQQNGGSFQMLGTFVLDSDSTIELTDQADGYVIADAIYLKRTTDVSILTSPEVFYYHTDHLGTPQKMTDSDGDLVWSADYQPFGQAGVTAASVENNLRFPGQYVDSETGLHYNWNRFYDPNTGRYLTPDPIGLAGGIDLYSYAYGNPINSLDPLGLTATAMEVVISVGKAGGGVAVGVGAGAIGFGAGSFVLGMPSNLADGTLPPGYLNGIGFDPAEKQRERKAIKARSRQRPPNGLDPCEEARWKLQREKDHLRMREAYTTKYYGLPDARHLGKNHQIKQAIKNLEKFIRNNCCG